MILEGKRLLITGVVNDDSIAFATAARAQELGAEIALSAFPRDLGKTLEAARKLPAEPPIVAADPPDGLVLDVTGAGHRYGGDEGLLEDLIAQTAAVGLGAHAALADTWGAAHALARNLAEPTIVVARGGPAIRRLPLPVY